MISYYGSFHYIQCDIIPFVYQYIYLVFLLTMRSGYHYLYMELSTVYCYLI